MIKNKDEFTDIAKFTFFSEVSKDKGMILPGSTPGE